MASWSDLQSYLRERFELDRDDADRLALTLSFEAEGHRRKQRVLLRRYEAFESEMVEIRSAFGQVDDFEPRHLLEQSLGFPIGNIALHGETLVIVQKMPLKPLTAAILMEVMTRIGFLADCLESTSGDDRY